MRIGLRARFVDKSRTQMIIRRQAYWCHITCLIISRRESCKLSQESRKCLQNLENDRRFFCENSRMKSMSEGGSLAMNKINVLIVIEFVCITDFSNGERYGISLLWPPKFPSFDSFIEFSQKETILVRCEGENKTNVSRLVSCTFSI